MEQVSVAIKKHRHKFFEGPEMVKFFFAPVLLARPGNLTSLCQRALSCSANSVRGADKTRMMAMVG